MRAVLLIVLHVRTDPRVLCCWCGCVDAVPGGSNDAPPAERHSSIAQRCNQCQCQATDKGGMTAWDTQRRRKPPGLTPRARLRLLLSPLLCFRRVLSASSRPSLLYQNRRLGKDQTRSRTSQQESDTHSSDNHASATDATERQRISHKARRLLILPPSVSVRVCPAFSI